MINLSRKECSAMRGVAILGIILHNFSHWLGMAVKENEYTFTQSNVDGLVNAIANPTINLPIHILSFFGHYGVPVFLFLSAYGLTIKYEKGGAEERILPFIKNHFVKLFTMMIVGYVAFLMVDRIDGPHTYHLMDVVSQLGLFNNVLPHPNNIIWPGPYWFFGLMMQLYIVYRLFLYKRHWSVTVVFVFFTFLLQAFCEPTGDPLNRLRYNFIGGMLPFGLGLIYGRISHHSLSDVLPMKSISTFSLHLIGWIVFIFTILLIYGWSLGFQSWFWVPAVICVSSVLFVKLTPDKINTLLAWFGSISSAMFICHPITRKIFIPISREGDIYTGLLLYVVATIVLSIGFQRILSYKKN